MSIKDHVWRDISFGKPDAPNRYNDCYVVEDAACFPVKEAMRLCKSTVENDGTFDKTAALGGAITAYKNAVARMKAKKGK